MSPHGEAAAVRKALPRPARMASSMASQDPWRRGGRHQMGYMVPVVVMRSGI